MTYSSFLSCGFPPHKMKFITTLQYVPRIKCGNSYTHLAQYQVSAVSTLCQKYMLKAKYLFKKKKSPIIKDNLCVFWCTPFQHFFYVHTFFVIFYYISFLKFYVFIIFIYFWLCWVFIHVRAFSRCSKQGLLSSCNVWASHRGGLLIVVGFSSWWASLGAEHGLQSTLFQQLQHVGSVVAASRLQNTGSTVVVQGFSCSKACGIFQDQGSNSCPSHWQADSLPLSCQRSPIYTLECSCD